MLWIRDVSFAKNNIQNLIINKDYLKLANIHGRDMKNIAADELIQYLQYTSENIKNNVNYKLTIDKMLLKIQEGFKI